MQVYLDNFTHHYYDTNWTLGPTKTRVALRTIAIDSNSFNIKTVESHASFLINEYNVNHLIIKERLGHEDIKTTLSNYSYLYPNVNFEVANIMSGSITTFTSSKKNTKFHGNQAVKYSDKNKFNVK